MIIQRKILGLFAGIIPNGEYEAGRVLFWDQGTCELIEKTAEKISFSLKGEKLKGNSSLLRLMGNRGRS